MARNPEETRRKLLASAHAEFAQSGLAGARIDRIAENAGVNKRMIYAYFGGKDELFAQVMEASIEALATAVPLDTEDVPAYAGLLFDYLISHPERRRLALWRLLEHDLPTDGEAASTQTKIAALDEVTAADPVLDGRTALVFLMALVQAWPNATPAATESHEDTSVQRVTVVEAVRRLLRR